MEWVIGMGIVVIVATFVLLALDDRCQWCNGEGFYCIGRDRSDKEWRYSWCSCPAGVRRMEQRHK